MTFRHMLGSDMFRLTLTNGELLIPRNWKGQEYGQFQNQTGVGQEEWKSQKQVKHGTLK